MPKPDIRLVALDLDGTLLTRDQQLPQEGSLLLRQAAQRGVHVVLATTRRYESTVRFYRELQLDTPFVCCNGAQVWASPDGPLWAEHCIAEATARAIAELADDQGWELGLTFPHMSYWRQRPQQPLGLFAPDITIVANNRDAVVGAPLRILTWHPQAIETLGAFCRRTWSEHCSVEVYVDGAGKAESLGIFAPLANKGVALNLVMARLGIAREQVVTIGDNFNDLPMFACGDISVAMANAPETVRQSTTLIAPSHNDEGVAWMLRKLQIV